MQGNLVFNHSRFIVHILCMVNFANSVCTGPGKHRKFTDFAKSQGKPGVVRDIFNY